MHYSSVAPLSLLALSCLFVLSPTRFQTEFSFLYSVSLRESRADKVFERAVRSFLLFGADAACRL
jgi:hypothetical protein